MYAIRSYYGRRDRANLAHQSRRRLHEMLIVLWLHERRLEAADRVDHRGQNRHRRCIRRETVEVVAHVLVNRFVLDQQAAKLVELSDLV